jgi:uncharacterized protein (TIGR03066 family)
MRVLGTMLAVFLVFGATARAEEKTDLKKQLVGKWEATKADEGTLRVGSLVEFTADGKMKVMTKKDDKDVNVTGTYTVEAHAFVFKLEFEGKERSEKITVKKISDTEMNTENKDGKQVTFKKVK